MKNETQILVVGNGMVGYKFCEKLKKKDPSGAFKITVLGEEPRPAYDRVHLSEYFSTRSADHLTMAPKEWYAENNINLVLGNPVVSIDREKKSVTTFSGDVYSYDKLILATGSAAFVPPIKGVDKDGIFVYRTIEDLEMMINQAQKSKVGAVIGGGLLGLEAAKALLDLGIKPHVIEFASRLMPRQLDEAGSKILQEKLESLGLTIHLNKNTSYFDGDATVTAMQFADDTRLELDMVVISAGIKPRDEVAKKAGLTVGPRGGIEVNDILQTSDEDIYAIGECALHWGMIYGLVAPGYEMAEVVAENLIKEHSKEFRSFDMSTKLKLIGVDVASFGDAFGAEEGSVAITYENKDKGIYKRLNLSADKKRVIGGILVGDAESYNMLLQMVNNKMALPPDPEDLILGSRGDGKSEGGNAGVMNLPDEALICSCEGVTKGAICGAVTDQNVTDLAGMKKCTKAGTGCGGCVPMVNDLISETLKSQGKVIKKVLCEHFDYSRQELLDLIKIHEYKNYDVILDELGKGDGCEICKPAVGSILASVWNEVILKQATIQDSNDRFLANLQKGGTYSVVPRVAGGEITAEKLIVLGQVAKKYDLYCKITGGQRIDLFGAPVHQLPDIWEELIDAGFESGHAYGKSLRTVKSCVGSTWCRFGVQDAVSYAIRIEERYKGIRSPHKVKMAVSGCVRECAEAQGKDFGIIATDKGWNLYVCGNGGAKPQHAILFASDLDDETCIKYIDRIMIFYIRTAEPLMRTATWLNKLEGGIEYLREVIINDSLGLNSQFEKELQLLVDTYHCEWKEVVENPELRKRFSTFINSDESDETMAFTEMRTQKKPANWKA
ncbi:nitrite reductase large subunit NirB [Cytophaga aurantiaca]|uniref:nitrite reductase large subunit NirB n=1 Tax=Cytophaga aurantiaca TaxID=29530 RepID=UPI0003719690|nr:nitrite reductase large subunit NirB [Cytophaga aurantiaca]